MIEKEDVLRIFDEMFDNVKNTHGFDGLTYEQLAHFSLGQMNFHPKEYYDLQVKVNEILSELINTRQIKQIYNQTYDLHFQHRMMPLSDGAKYKRNNAVTSGRSAHSINNHVCPTCSNDRVNVSEKNCWKCGGALHKP